LTVKTDKIQAFQQALLHWFDKQGRKHLPWKHPLCPYRIWVSEIMLQQTQVTTVIPYFERFMQHFPTVESLAAAELDQVLQLWAGLGYYTRARCLHKAAQQIVALGDFPKTLTELTALPGIGLSTAGAILSLAFDIPTPILDGNVRRVLVRIEGVYGWSGESAIQQQLWKISQFYTPNHRVAEYTQAMMDLGALICKRRPDCKQCPVIDYCWAYQQQQTDQLPTTKPRVTKPCKSVVMLVLHSQKHWLLSKRPTRGIWGGLWSLPEFDTIESAINTVKLLNNSIQPQIFATQRHSFTHYHLNYTPLYISIPDPISELEPNQSWHHQDLILSLALPAPIKPLLLNLIDSPIK
jgi:A/G-specific adenine glycosylase